MDFQDFCLGGAVKIQTFPNPNCKVFHTRGKLVDYAGYDDYMSDISFIENNNVNVPVLTQAIYDSIKKIEGVDEVSIWPYRVQIVIYPLFSWKPILLQIKRVFASYLQWEAELGKGPSKWK